MATNLAPYSHHRENPQAESVGEKITPPTGETIPGLTIPSIESSLAIEMLKIRELKCLAMILGIPKYSNLKRDEILNAIKSFSTPISENQINEARAKAKSWKN